MTTSRKIARCDTAIDRSKPRRQCAKCPWKVGTDPRSIPHGYDPRLHRRLKSTLAEPGSLHGIHGPLKIMACHDSPVGKELPCVGWLVNQLGPGQNLALRLAVATRRISANVETDGPQHETLQDTLPKPRRRR